MMSSTTDLTGQMIIAGSPVRGSGAEIRGFDPSSGTELDPVYRYGDASHVEAACAAADAAFGDYRATTREQRASFLEAIADNIEAIRDELVDRAVAETGLPQARLTGEVGRTTGQLRLFAGVVREGSWTGARIDPALPDRTPLPRPDIRQRSIAIGPVAVFGASNFPLAFSVAGGDTASALAAGCPVVVKAHDAHPGTSELVGRAVTDAVRALGPARRDLLAAVRIRAGPRHRARHRSAHQGGRFHRITFGRNGTGGRSGRAARADPGVRRDELDQPGVPARRCAGRKGRRHRPRLRGFADHGLRTVLHQPRPGDRRRRARSGYVHRRGARRAGRDRADRDADTAHRRHLSARRRGAAGRGRSDRPRRRPTTRQALAAPRCSAPTRRPSWPRTRCRPRCSARPA